MTIREKISYQSLMEKALQVNVLTPDLTPPELLTAVLDLNSGSLNLTFDDVIKHNYT